MLSRKRILDSWVDVRQERTGTGLDVEEIVRFARLVEAAALENEAARPRKNKNPGVALFVQQIRARAKAAREAAGE